MQASNGMLLIAMTVEAEQEDNVRGLAGTASTTRRGDMARDLNQGCFISLKELIWASYS